MSPCHRCGGKAKFSYSRTGMNVCESCVIPLQYRVFLIAHAELADVATLFDSAELSGLFS